MLDTAPLLSPSSFPRIRRERLETLQVNLGYRCNQSCRHCHVNAGSKRTELMRRETVDTVLAVLRARRIGVLDLTGGAPELNPHFRDLVRMARGAGVRVMDRCNLTILCEPGQEDLAEFLAGQGVAVIASLPCYLEENVDAQRGDGAFAASIIGLRRLNAMGYGEAKGMELNLVYNPQGAVLPPDQRGLEADYKRKLLDGYGIRFNHLYTITNMPISRFGSTLLSRGGGVDDYLRLLKEAHCGANLATVMCRSLLSVDWRGYLYDCDFNQMLEMPLLTHDGAALHLSRLLDEDPGGMRIRTAEHCYGCTAGSGSSCGGALS